MAIGNEGLLKAVRKFDPDQGVKFISYAVWWVRQAVLKALAEQTRSVRIPLNQNSQLIRLARAETILAQVLKRDPTEHEICRLLEETPEQVRAAKQMSATEVSLDAPIDRSDREASTLGERFAGVDGTEIEDVTDYKLMREFIDRVFRKYLTPRERKILYLYYGLEERLRGDDAREDRRADGRDPRAHPADPRARVREAARVARRSRPRGILAGGLTPSAIPSGIAPRGGAGTWFPAPPRAFGHARSVIQVRCYVATSSAC